MAPLLIDHAYVAPAMRAVLALPEAPGQRFGGAVMTGDGEVATVTVVGADDAEQLPYDTVTL